MKKIKFSVDSFEVIVNDPSFMVLQMDVISDGVNSHGTEFMAEDIVDSIPNISNKPINCTMEYGDFKNHAFTSEEEKKQVGVGTIPESNRAKMIVKDGKNFLRINSIIWKYLFPDASEILTRREKVDISMEITPTKTERKENGVIIIKEWNYEAVTLLGRYISPAIKDAKAIVVKYSNDKDYFNDVMIKYGILFDDFIVPDNIVDECKGILSELNNDPKLLSLAEKLSDFNKYNYNQIIELNGNLSEIDWEDSKITNNGLIQNWFSTIIKEKEGGNKVDKIKEALLSKLTETQKYAYHNEDNVFVFDLLTAKYKSFTYSTEEVEKVITVKFGEEQLEVIKIKDADDFVLELGEGQEAEDSISYSIEKYAELISRIEEVKTEKEALETNYSESKSENEVIAKTLEDEKVKYSDLEKVKTDLEDKILGFSKIEEELTTLRDYKINKEEELKSNAINSLYSKYKDFLSKEEIVELNVIAKDMDMTDFSKEVYSIVMPKFEAKIEALSANGDKGASTDNLKYTSIPKVIETEKEEGSDLLSKLERI